MEETPAYYAIIPATVRYDKRIPPNAKLLYGEVTALCNKEGFCWATNPYFADLYEVHKDTVSEWISKLKKCGYFRIEFDKMAGNRRRIYLAEMIPQPIGKNADPIGKNTDTPYRQKGRTLSVKTPVPIGENADSYRQKDRHNNKDNSKGNNTGNNTENLADANATVSLEKSSGQKPKKKPPQVPRTPPADTPIVTRIRQVVEAKIPGYYWDGKNGKAAQLIAGKLKAGIIKKLQESNPETTDCTDDDIVNAFTVLVTRTAELKDYYQFTDLPALNSKYNEIVTQLRENARNKTNGNSSNGRPVAPAQRTTADRVSNLTAMFDQFDNAFSGQ